MKETIAVIFDFDDTLAPDSTSGLLQKLGIDVEKFWRDEVQPLIDQDWDPVPAYLVKMIEKSRNGEVPTITKTVLENWGQELPLHAGVPTIFERLRLHAREINPRISVEFYLISSGIEDVLRHTRIAHEFHDIWASNFSYDQDGAIAYPKKVISFTDKTRYIFYIKKGLSGQAVRGKPFEVNRKISPEALRIPLNQMIFVGDGYTDIPCFSLIRKGGGIAIGVYDNEHSDRWGRAWGFVEDGRVSNLVPAEYEPKTALSNSLTMAIESLVQKISLQHNIYQG